MATLIHLNGAPGVGKSTLAGRYAAEHPGVLDCDLDRLRCLVGGWEADFDGVGALVRPLALAMIRAHLDNGRDVVLPQMLADESQRARFRAAAVENGHAYAHVLLQAPRGVAGARFFGRAASDPLHRVIRDVIDREGGEAAIDALERRLALAAATDRATIVLDAGADIEETYRAMVGALGS